MIKKLAALLLILSLAASLLAGCGSQGNQGTETTTGTGTQTEGTTAPAPEDKHYDIKLAGYPAVLVEKDSPVEKFLEEKFNVSIDVFSVDWANYNDKLAALIAGGDIPDVIFSFEPQNWQPLVDQEVLAEVPVDTIKTFAPGLAKDIEETDPALWAVSAYKGKNWAVPKIVGTDYATVTVWRKDWLDKAGITKVPETLQEYEEAFVKFKGLGDNIYGITGQGGHTVKQFDSIFGAYGIIPGQWRVVDGKVTMSTIMPQAIEALALLNSWYSKGLIDPEFITDNPNTLRQKFESGRLGTQETSLSNYHASMPSGYQILDAWKERDPNAQFALGPIPAGTNGKRAAWSWGPRGNFVIFGEQLGQEPDKMGRILTMLDTMYSDEETALRVYWGEKGKTYDFNDPAVGAQSGLKFMPPYDTDLNEKAKQGLGDFFMLFKTVYDWASPSITAKYMPQDYKALADKIASRQEGSRDAIMRAYLPSSPQYQANLDTLKVVAYSEFITGKRPLSEWNKFIQEWLDQGGRVLTEEAQKFYDENVKPFKK